MVPSQGGRAQLCGRLIVFGSGVFSCGRSRWRWHLGPGVNRDVPLGPGHLRRCRGRRKAVQTDQRHAWNITSCSERWSRGRIVSALLAGAQGGCRPSAESPNPIAATMGPPAGVSNGFRPFDTALHRRQRLSVGGFMAQGQAPSVAPAGSPGPAGCCAPAARVWGHRQPRPWRC